MRERQNGLLHGMRPRAPGALHPNDGGSVKTSSTVSSIHFSINGREFYAEGDASEVSRKLNEFMDSVFAPVRNAIAASNWRQTLEFRADQRVTLPMVESRFRQLA